MEKVFENEKKQFIAYKIYKKSKKKLKTKKVLLWKKNIRNILRRLNKAWINR